MNLDELINAMPFAGRTGITFDPNVRKDPFAALNDNVRNLGGSGLCRAG